MKKDYYCESSPLRPDSNEIKAEMIKFTNTVKFLIVGFILTTGSALAQNSDIKKLKSLSMEELMDIEVTSVSKVPEKLSGAASAVQVITNDDIRRSGARSIPEALRLASNLQVSQLNSSAWIISARGFNTTFANKLLVLIDGRSVYTPLFGGVLWEMQSVLLEDVDRIEVISGPGGTLWGANAVNGVINIITKKAADSQGLYLSALGGNYLEQQYAGRYGDSIGSKTAYRVYAQHNKRLNTFVSENERAHDSWQISQAGFSVDITPNDVNSVSIQGNAYTGFKSPVAPTGFDGQNAIVKWKKQLKNGDFILQTYYDRYWRDDPTTADQMQTFDFDFQNRRIFSKHELLWGVGYRHVKDEVTNRSTFVGLVPATRNMPLYSGFIQDELALARNLRLTLGSKFLHNIFSGFEIQPNVRLAYRMRANTLWAAVSRAIRQPSRFDVDYHLPIEPQPPNVQSVDGGPNFTSEKLLAYELGYRGQAADKLSFSISGFYNHYTDVYSVEALPGTLTYQIQNGSLADTWGGELYVVYEPVKSWRVRGGYSYIGEDLRAKPGHPNNNPSYLANDAKNHVMLQSMLKLGKHFDFDVIGRYMDRISQSFATVRVPAYTTFDIRLSYTVKFLEASVVGQNLASQLHSEYGKLKVPRNYYVTLACRF